MGLSTAGALPTMRTLFPTDERTGHRDDAVSLLSDRRVGATCTAEPRIGTPCVGVVLHSVCCPKLLRPFIEPPSSSADTGQLIEFEYVWIRDRFPTIVDNQSERKGTRLKSNNLVISYA